MNINVRRNNCDLYALIGKMVDNSFSPYIYNYLFNHYRINGFYTCFNVEEEYFENAILGAKALGIKGINITNPYKEKVTQYVESNNGELDVINTIKNTGQHLLGYNTDYFGLIRFFESECVKIKGGKVLIFGAGGTAKTICKVLTDLEASEIIVLNRTIDKAKNMLKNFEKRRIFYNIGELNSENINLYIKNVDIVIDATSCDLFREKILKIDFEEILGNKKVFFDVKYNPKTWLIKEARDLGFKALDGLGMLIFQAFENFKIWTDIYPDMECCTRIYETLKKK